MKATIKVEKEVNIVTLKVAAGVRYWEDAEIDSVPDEDGTATPCRQGELWCPLITFDTGVITNWTIGVKADIHFKVCDSGSYYLIDENGEIVLSIEGDYVPACMCPGGSGYGDYIIMQIDENGVIDGWCPDLDGFVEDDE